MSEKSHLICPFARDAVYSNPQNVEDGWTEENMNHFAPCLGARCAAWTKAVELPTGTNAGYCGRMTVFVRAINADGTAYEGPEE